MNSSINNIQENLIKETATNCISYEGPREIIDFLDEHFPMNRGSHKDAKSYGICYQHLIVHLKDGTSTGLRHSGDLVDICGRRSEPEAIVLSNGRLSAEIDLYHSGAIKSALIQK